MKKLIVAVILAVACCVAPVLVGAGPNISDGVNFFNIQKGTTYTTLVHVRNLTSDTADYNLFYEAPTFSPVGKSEKTGSAVGYVNIGDQANKWVTIGTSDAGQSFIVTIGSGKTVDVPVKLLIPKDATVPNSWVFWIGDMPTVQEGSFLLEVHSTCLVSMNTHANLGIIFASVGGLVVIGMIVLVFKRTKNTK